MDPDDDSSNKWYGSVKAALAEIFARLNAIESWQKTVDAKLGTIEARLGALESELAVIKSNYVTKADLHAAMHVQTWRFAGILAAYTAAVYFIARSVH